VIINLLRYLKEPALILCPPSLIPNWIDEFKFHSYKGDFKVEALTDKEADVKRARLKEGISADVLLVGYETAALYQEEIFEAYNYKTIVADESQKIKSIKSQRTKAAMFLASKAYRRIIMSGTAVLNAPTDLYPQLSFLCPTLVESNYYAFCRKYQEYSAYNKHIVVGYKNMNILNKRVNSVAIKYTKEECLDLPERPPLIKQKFDLSPEQCRVYYDLLTDETLYLDEGEISKSHKVVILGKLAQVTGGFLNVSQKDEHICDNCPNMMSCVENKIKPYTKMCAVVKEAPPVKIKTFKTNAKLATYMDLVDSIVTEPTNKIITWARHVWELDAIEGALKKAKIKYHALPPEASKIVATVNEFNSDPDSKVLLGQVSRGVGFTCNSANYTIYYSITFSLEDYLQSRDRNYRVGQKRKVTEYMLVGNDTIDEHVIQALWDKQDIQDTLLSNVQCLNCNNSMACLVEGIQAWDPGCSYSAKKTRKVLKVK
jgi:SNF2 family DNA or RNA helicase